MANNRKWISREEIAEIYDVLAERAEKTEPKLGESIMRTVDKNIVKRNKFRAHAADVRATDQLGHPMGTRVA